MSHQTGIIIIVNNMGVYNGTHTGAEIDAAIDELPQKANKSTSVNIVKTFINVAGKYIKLAFTNAENEGMFTFQSIHVLGYPQRFIVSWWIHSYYSNIVKASRKNVIESGSNKITLYLSETDNALYISTFQYGLFSIMHESYRNSLPTYSEVTSLPADAVEITAT